MIESGAVSFESVAENAVGVDDKCEVNERNMGSRLQAATV